MAKVALLIGVGTYEHPDALKPLVSAPKDVAAMQRILNNEQMGEFSEVISLIDPDPMQMQEAIETLYRDRAKDDLVLLFFSGHGIKDDSGRLHFATRLTRKTPKGDLIQSTAVPARFVQEIMGKSRSRRQVIILDCCFSGAFDPALNAKDDGSVDLQKLGAEGRVVLTSSSSTQYSFEQQGSDLSIYTRFLVEGIETGAADRDNDGKVSVRELHEYASQKVQEMAPTMNPKIIVLKDEGFDIVFAKAQITDPNLKYRKEAERYSMRGEISLTGRALLNALRERLGVTREEAQEIEEQVLQPFRERLKRIEDYRSAFVAEVERQYPLTQETLSELKDLREILGLRKEDVTPVEQEIISQIVSKSESYRHSLQRYEQEFTKAIQSEFPLSQPVSESLNKLQANLGLIDEDVAQIKRLTLERRDAEDRQPQLEPQKLQDVEKARQPNEEVQELQPERRREDQQPTSPEDGTVRSSNKVLLAGACLSSILITGGLFYFNSTRLQPQPDVQKSPSPSVTPTPIASLPSSPKPTTSPKPSVISTNTPISSLPKPTTSPKPSVISTNTPVSSLPTPTPTGMSSNERKYITVKTNDRKISLRNGPTKTAAIIETLTPYTVVFCGDEKQGEEVYIESSLRSSDQWRYCKTSDGHRGFIHSLLLVNAN